MSFSESDFVEIMLHAEKLFLDEGLQVVVDEARSAFDKEYRFGGNYRDSTVKYLEAAISLMRRRSLDLYMMAFDLAKDYISTESGEPISGFSVVFDRDKDNATRDEEFFLEQVPNIRKFLEDLQDVVNALKQS